MTPEEIREVASRCNRFLVGHGPTSVRDRLLAIADDPWSELPNDHYGQGGAVALFEGRVADLLGKEAAVFMLSGTMAQQIALRIWADEAANKTVLFHPTCHLEAYEQMAYRELHGLRAILLGAADRLFTLEELQSVGETASSLLIELPQREIGGQLPTWDQLVAITDYAKSRQMRLHLDGARLWECGPFYAPRSYAEIAAPFDSVYVSFYKILNGLPGAILAGPEEFIQQSRVWMRRHGGNLQQQSPSVIAAKIGLDRYLPRVPEYVAKAQEIAASLRSIDGLRLVPEKPPTNMMHVYLPGDPGRLSEAALALAQETRDWTFARLGPDGKFELYAGEGTMAFSGEEVGDLFRAMIERANA